MNEPKLPGGTRPSRSEPVLPKGADADLLLPAHQIVALQRDLVDRWHRTDEVDCPHTGLAETVTRQHGFNFRLWHQEDIARSPHVSDTEIAAVKRRIDKLNQQRNDWMENVDDAITEQLAEAGIEPRPDARLNTETPGSVIDRLSILSLRIYHLEEEEQRLAADPVGARRIAEKLAVCRLQLAELAGSLQELFDDLCAGRKRHRTYRHHKMYNDPTLNPYLYKSAG